MASRRVAQKGFLAKLLPSVEGTYLLKPDRILGRAGVKRARDPQSRDVLIKYWPRAKGIDHTDLEEIWRSEIRQLQRLAAVPRADDLFVPMLSSGKDEEENLYLVLDPGSEEVRLIPICGLRGSLIFSLKRGNRVRARCSGPMRAASRRHLRFCIRRPPFIATSIHGPSSRP